MVKTRKQKNEHIHLTGRTFFFANGGIPWVGKRTWLPITQSSDIVLIPTEILCCSSSKFRQASFQFWDHTHLTLYEQKWWFITDQITSSLCITLQVAKHRQRGLEQDFCFCFLASCLFQLGEVPWWLCLRVSSVSQSFNALFYRN